MWLYLTKCNMKKNVTILTENKNSAPFSLKERTKNKENFLFLRYLRAMPTWTSSTLVCTRRQHFNLFIVGRNGGERRCSYLPNQK